ncbi:MAG: hypothetical protein DRI86_03185 [Bacteroidetes bacterium]|nr:MAG: hypothetical protein DRI86_03185 [Bacteroidota bacterium]
MSTNIYKTYNTIIKIVIIIVSISFLINQLFIKQDIMELWNSFINIFDNNYSIVLFIITVLAMPLNWSIEAYKWKYLLKDTEEISFSTALRAIFSGTTISAVSPNRTGDYLARVFVLNKTGFWHGVLITLIGSYAQNIVTLVVGGFAFFGLFAPKLIALGYLSADILLYFEIVFFIVLVIIIILYYKISLLTNIVPKKWRRIHIIVNIFKQFKFNKLSIVLNISLIRYLVYTLQYYLILRAVGFTDLGIFEGMALVTSTFLINSIRPSIALLEIGIRGSVAIFVFGLYYGFDVDYQNQVFAASSIIWFINIVLPAIIGLFFIRDLKFFKKNTKND